MKFSVYQISRQGGREINEDRAGYAYSKESSLFVLADGMGGHPQGEVAAQTAIQTFSTQFQKMAQPRVGDVPEFLRSTLLEAHHRLISYAAQKAMLDTPRTTLVAALIERSNLHWIHCGDSRLYIVRNGALLTRTRDHSYTEQQARLGLSTQHANRNVLFTCLGSPLKPVFDLAGPLPLQQGDLVLLCSDGLWGTVKDEEIVAAMNSKVLERAVPELVNMALKRGGSRCDNVTVLAMAWESPEKFQDSYVCTDDAKDGLFSSTIIPEYMADITDEDLQDDAIAKSIAEIQEAIERSQNGSSKH